MKTAKQYIALLLALLTIFQSSCGNSNNKENSKTLNLPEATVDHVIDGDTVVVIFSGQKEHVRLIGIDTPESRINKRVEKQRELGDAEKVIELGKKAKEFTKSLVKPGDKVYLEFDVQQRDRYGRLLAYVYLQDGRMLNKEIICNGYAMPLTIPPNVKYEEELRKCYQEAREKGLGLWKEWKLKENKKNKTLIHIIETIVFIFVVVSLVRVFLVQAFNIPSGSMKPTLLIGDFILVNKLVYGNWDIGIPFTNITFYHHNNRLAKIDRGDIIVFKYPEDPSIDFIKRVVGLPGDIVEVKNDIIYLNGKPLKREPAGFYEEENEKVKKYIETTYRTNGKLYSYTVMEIEDGIGADFGPIQVPPNSYFVMGDNRDNSKDSRFWGFVPDDYVVGQAFVIYFSVDLKKPAIRFDRLGKVIY